ncbi:TonB-dependent receptor [Sphingomonas aracearum]|uniref:TonB-dependent receptor n=1 Tax=Sphingomonas aracearum TaxID=2283317 RepID=A0A369VUU5_9SPHN|nr:TonB-dependent receptor [Sphingomonas aracearum]RDE06144.1 TonB-dependent receptor [Sphingomonas aracearum]
MTTPAAPPPASSEVVVLGRGLDLPPGTPAYGQSLIDRDRLTNDASNRVEDVLADVAGVQQFRRSDSRSANPSAQGLTLRALGGNASSRALVLLDGVPQTDPFFGYIPFTAFSPERLGAVRITRGGGSGPFGAGAVAGTVELVSADRSDLPLVSGQASYGSYDSQQISGVVTPDIGRGFVSAFGRYERSDGFYTTPEDQRVAATARARFEDWSAGLRTVAPIGPDTELQATALAFRDNRTLRFAGADSSSEGEDASVRLVHRGAWQVDALAYLQARNFTNKVISATSFRLTLDQRNTPSTGYGGKIELRPPVGGDHVLRLGVDYRGADGELFEDAYNATSGAVTARRNAGGAQSTVGAFVEDDWTIGRLVLTGGGRVDRWTITNGFFAERSGAGVLTTDTRYRDRDGTIATGRLGALFHAVPGVDLRAAAYTGFRLPTLNELYRPFVVFPITTQANAGLGLEKLKGYEAGLDLSPVGGVTLGVTAFYNRLDDAIANVTVGANLRQRQNVDAVVARGVEVTGQVRHGAVSLQASYALNDSEVRAPGLAFNGFVPAQSPRHAASGTLAWAPRRGPSLSATLRYIGRQYEDDLQTDVLRAATVVDAVASLPVAPGVRLVGRAENLFDEEVVTRNAGGSIDLGTPRTFWIGVRFGR